MTADSAHHHGDADSDRLAKFLMASLVSQKKPPARWFSARSSGGFDEAHRRDSIRAFRAVVAVRGQESRIQANGGR